LSFATSFKQATVQFGPSMATITENMGRAFGFYKAWQAFGAA
jgi:hypothetical protein